MVRQYWYAIARSSDITKGPVALTRFGQEIVLWRDSSGALVCLPDRCSHRGAPLSRGRVLKNGCLQCPYHGLEFDGMGRCVLIPANGAGHAISPVFHLDRLPVREQDGFVWLWWGHGPPAPAIPSFEEAPPPSVAACTITLDWNVSFSRVMESMFDIHHFPFLHRKVSHGMGCVVDPYHVEMTGNRIESWGSLRHDTPAAHRGNGSGNASGNRNGNGHKKGKGDFEFRVSVLFPALMYMGLTEKLKLLVVAAPVDEQRTWLALRYYQTYTQLPVLATLVARLSAELERKFVHPDDERQLEVLRPPREGDAENRFIKADQGTAVWLRRYRQELAAQRGETLDPARRARQDALPPAYADID